MNLCWFRNDLRLSDNPALHSAVKGGKTTALYIFEEKNGSRALGSASKAWLHHSLISLQASLSNIGIKLILARGDAELIVPDLVEKLGVENVYWNRRYHPKDVETDKHIKTALLEKHINVESFKANLLFEPWEIVSSGNGTPYKVFSPFWKAALKKGNVTQPLRKPETETSTPVEDEEFQKMLSSWQLLPWRPDWASGFWKHWTVGEAAAQTKLARFLENNLAHYSDGRDFPEKSSTSGLSPYLRFGEISPRQIWNAVYMHEAGELSRNGIKFLAEIGWREFSHSILFYADQLEAKNWRPEFDAFAWKGEAAKLEAWKRGQTGYPLADAGMRELWQTGYMHNRVRMVVASFLIKHLQIDWREGEKWFWDTLLDACPANNPASWQWVAGSGADAAPYFRIFNPTAQSEKFDGEGDYIRQWIPELARLDDRSIHDPSKAPSLVLKAAGVVLDKTYPNPIVDHKEARLGALAAYKEMKASNT